MAEKADKTEKTDKAEKANKKLEDRMNDAVNEIKLVIKALTARINRTKAGEERKELHGIRERINLAHGSLLTSHGYYLLFKKTYKEVSMDEQPTTNTK